MCFAIGIIGPYWAFYLNTSLLFLDYSVPGVIFLLFVLVLVFNVLLRLVSKKLALKTGELVLVTAMMLVGGAVTTMGLVGYLVPNISAPYYFATPSNQWQEKLWPALAGWMSPLDKGGGTSAIDRFYGGLKPGEPIPWAPWIKPLLCWAIFLAALYLCMTAIMTIVRKQWVDYERLTFPIAQVPQALCTSAAHPAARSSIFRSFLFWAGFAIPFLLGSVRALNGYFPSVPDIPIYTSLKGVIRFHIYLSFAVLGFTFLIPNRVAFSLWFLNLISWLVRYQTQKYGLDMQEKLSGYGASDYPIMAHMGMGAMLVFVAAGLWLSRAHLGRVLRCSLGIGDTGYDADEPCSYRTALVLFVATSTVMLVWLRFSGLSVVYAIVFLVLAMAIFYGLTRIVAQCGVSVTISPMIAPCLVTSTVGSANVTARGIGSLTMAWTWCSDIRTTVMSSAAHGMYLARRKARGLMWAMMVGIAIAAVTSTLYTIYLGYRHGALNLHSWFFIAGPKMVFNWGFHEIESGRGPNAQGLLWTGVGGAIMVALVLAQRMLFWWPIHPVGFIICSVSWTDRLWLPIFLAWFVKVLVVRLGGNRMFRMARGFFLGMILGQFTMAGFWAVVDTIMNKLNNSVHWI